MPDYNKDNALQHLKTGDEKAIDWLFREYYASMCQSAYRILPDEHLIEDLVQDVFYEIWKKRKTLKINTSIAAYLRQATRNKTLNYIRDQKIDFRNAPPKEELKSKNTLAVQTLMADDLQQEIDAAIDSLPERCRLVFVLSRFEEMSYQEIADQLGISIKTVEHQIGKALRSLREALGGYLSISIVLTLYSVLETFIINFL